MTESGCVLVVDDEPQIRRALGTNLRARGYDVVLAASGEEALTLAAERHPDVVILDLGLPGIDGIEVVRGLRGWASMPIVVLSVREGEADKVAALDAGADDYLTKPFGVSELAARIRVALRHASRPAGSPTPVYEATVDGRTLHVNTETRVVKVSDPSGARQLRLTPTEFKLLAFLIKHAGKVLTHQQILRDVWGPTHAHDVQYLRVYAGQLRHKLEASAAQPQFVLTEPGVGYRLTPPNEAGPT